MKKPPQEYQQQHAHRVNCQQLKASSPTNKNTPATQDMSREEPAEELDRDNVYGRLPAHRVRRLTAKFWRTTRQHK